MMNRHSWSRMNLYTHGKYLHQLWWNSFSLIPWLYFVLSSFSKRRDVGFRDVYYLMLCSIGQVGWLTVVEVKPKTHYLLRQRLVLWSWHGEQISTAGQLLITFPVTAVVRPLYGRLLWSYVTYYPTLISEGYFLRLYLPQSSGTS